MYWTFRADSFRAIMIVGTSIDSSLHASRQLLGSLQVSRTDRDIVLQELDDHIDFLNIRITELKNFRSENDASAESLRNQYINSGLAGLRELETGKQLITFQAASERHSLDEEIQKIPSFNTGEVSMITHF